MPVATFKSLCSAKINGKEKIWVGCSRLPCGKIKKPAHCIPLKMRVTDYYDCAIRAFILGIRNKAGFACC